ncbi:MAG TPA: hypothetical protein VF785_19405, partial [Gemmatimonadaceae bacterium]
MTMRFVRLAVISALLAAAMIAVLSSPTVAQRTATTPSRPRTVVATTSANRTNEDADVPDLEAEPVLVVNGAPRSFQVVKVPVPPEFPTDLGVSYDVVATSSAPLLGKRSGGLVGGRARERVVVLTVGIPAVAVAGRTTIAYVRFYADSARAVRVPVDLSVPAIPRVRITPAQTLRGARPGEQFEMWFEIANAGNLRDTLDLRVDAPPTWNARFTVPARVVLQPGETISRSLRMVVPLASDIGDFPVTLIAFAGLTERARATTIVEVSDGMRASQRSGPVVTIGAASALSQGSSTHAVETIAVDGPLSDGVTVSGRLATPMPADPMVNRALAT